MQYSEHQLEALEKLVKSEGWKIFCELCNDKKLEVAESIIKNFGKSGKDEELLESAIQARAIEEILQKPYKILKSGELKSKSERLLGQFD